MQLIDDHLHTRMMTVPSHHCDHFFSHHHYCHRSHRDVTVCDDHRAREIIIVIVIAVIMAILVIIVIVIIVIMTIRSDHCDHH